MSDLAERLVVGIVCLLTCGTVAWATLSEVADHAEKATLPACAVEDGSSGPLPCRWDAGTEGNGQGDSFTITSTGPGHRLATYDDGTTADVSDR